MGQKARAHTDQAGGNDGRRVRRDRAALVVQHRQREHQNGGAGDKPQTGGEPIEPVDEVHGVDKDHGEDRGQDCGLELIQDHRGAAAHRHEEQGPRDTKPRQHRRGHELAEQLHHGAELKEVIDHAHRHDGERGPHHRGHLRGDGHEPAGKGGQLRGQEDSAAEPEEHGQPTQPRGRLGVAIALTNLRHPAAAHQKGTHDARGQIRQDGGHQNDQPDFPKRDAGTAHGLPPFARAGAQLRGVHA